MSKTSLDASFDPSLPSSITSGSDVNLSVNVKSSGVSIRNAKVVAKVTSPAREFYISLSDDGSKYVGKIDKSETLYKGTYSVQITAEKEGYNTGSLSGSFSSDATPGNSNYLGHYYSKNVGEKADFMYNGHKYTFEYYGSSYAIAEDSIKYYKDDVFQQGFYVSFKNSIHVGDWVWWTNDSDAGEIRMYVTSAGGPLQFYIFVKGSVPGIKLQPTTVSGYIYAPLHVLIQNDDGYSFGSNSDYILKAISNSRDVNGWFGNWKPTMFTASDSKKYLQMTYSGNSTGNLNQGVVFRNPSGWDAYWNLGIDLQAAAPELTVFGEGFDTKTNNSYSPANLTLTKYGKPGSDVYFDLDFINSGNIPFDNSDGKLGANISFENTTAEFYPAGINQSSYYTFTPVPVAGSIKAKAKISMPSTAAPGDLVKGKVSATMYLPTGTTLQGIVNLEAKVPALPSALISGPANGSNYMVSDSITFDGSSSTGASLSYEWKGNDTVLGSGSTLNLKGSDLGAGTHTITLTVTDAVGASSSTNIQLTVRDPNKCSVSGTISKYDGSSGVGNVTVSAVQNGSTVKSATSASDGTYKITDLPSGSYNIVATYGTYASQLQNVNVSEGLETPGINLSIGPSITSIGSNPNNISPGSSPGIKDSSLLSYNLSNNSYVTVKILDLQGNIIKTLLSNSSQFSGLNTKTWDGKNDTGQIVTDGMYRVEIDATDTSGFPALSAAGAVFIDNTVPALSDVQATPSFINPQGDENIGSIVYNLSSEANATLKIYDSSNNLVRKLVDDKSRSAGVNVEQWDGRNDTGEIVDNGTYKVKIDISDEAGNTGTSQEVQLNVAKSWVFSDDLSTDTNKWSYLGSAQHTSNAVTLTENVDGQVGAIWLDKEVHSPFEAEFNYKAGGGTGADGFVFMFNKDKNYALTGGNTLGFGNPVNGYGIEFDNYQDSYDTSSNHVALIKDAVSNHLKSKDDVRTEDNEWHHVKVKVGRSSVTVWLDYERILDWGGDVDKTYGNIGFAAATRASNNNWHVIDDFKITAVDDWYLEDKGGDPNAYVGLEPAEGGGIRLMLDNNGLAEEPEGWVAHTWARKDILNIDVNSQTKVSWSQYDKDNSLVFALLASGEDGTDRWLNYAANGQNWSSDVGWVDMSDTPDKINSKYDQWISFSRNLSDDYFAEFSVKPKVVKELRVGHFNYTSWDGDHGGTAANISIGSDNLPPAAPSNLTPSPNSWTKTSSFSIDWTNPSDDSGIAGAYYKLGSAPTSDTDGTLTTEKPFTVNASAENQTIYVWLKDGAGNKSYQNRASTTLKYDSTAPSSGTISINGGASSTNNLIVTLNSLSATDNLSGISKMRFSNDGIDNWSDEETYQSTKSNWDLSSFGGSTSSGTKKVYVKFKDGAGNWSQSFYDEISYSQAPSEEYYFITKWGSYGTGDGQFNFPTGVSVDFIGNVYVVDRYNHRIQKFNSNGNIVAKWGDYGPADGQLSYPIGIDIGISGDIYVADQSNHRIQKFDSNGNFLTKWGEYGIGNGQFSFPTGIGVDSNSNVYVADYNNDRIQKFSSTGIYINQWGDAGLADGQFNRPSGIAIDSNDNIYVADSNNNRIQKFDSNGNFLTKWGSTGSADGQFNGPYELDVDSSGNVFVVDIGNHRIQKFDSNGKFITKWGEYGTESGKFNFSTGIGVDSNNNVYVADTFNNRIQKFSKIAPPDTTPPTITSFTVPNISTNVSSSLGFSIKWAGADNPNGSGLAGYHLQYRPHTTTAWTTLKVDGNSWTTKKSRCFKGTKGYTYYFKVRAKDKAGNISGWKYKRAVVPYDQGVFTYSGKWSTANNSKFYLGSAKYSSSKGSYAKYKASKGTKQIYIIGTKRPTSGKMEIWLNGAKQTTISLYSSNTYFRKVLWSKQVDSTKANTVKIVVTGTKSSSSSGKRIDIDGVAVLK